MLERATTILALATFLFSCATQVATQPPSAPQVSSPPPQPVLLPRPHHFRYFFKRNWKGRGDDFEYLERGLLHMVLGSLAIYVDGLLKWKDSLGALPDQSFLKPGGTTLYTTPVELVGRHEVRAVLDKEEKTVEEDK